MVHRTLPMDIAAWAVSFPVGRWIQSTVDAEPGGSHRAKFSLFEPFHVVVKVRGVAETDAVGTGVQVTVFSHFAGFRDHEVMNVRWGDDGTEVLTCSSEDEELQGVKIGQDVVLEFPWEGEEGAGVGISRHGLGWM